MGLEYDNELDKTLKINIVVQVGTDFYAIREPDSGLSITDEYLQVKSPKINGVTVDVRKSNTPISTFSFQLVEFEFNKTSSKIMLDENQFLEKPCIVYVGHSTGSFDFADYIEIARTKITKVTKIANGYSFISKEVSHLIAQPALDLNDILNTFILATSTSLSITDTTKWASTGLIRVGSEFIFYTGKDVDGKTFTGLNRGVNGSVAAEHQVGTPVYFVTPLEVVNPVDMILQILLSKDGDLTNDPTYDVLENGLGIDPSNVNISAMENIRDTHFLGEEHELFIWGQDDLLKYLEKFLLPSTNLRFITNDGKISVSLLDQVNFNESPPIIDENSIIGTPTWSLTSDKLVNIIDAFWDYNFATGKYETYEQFRDEDSITTFGEKKPLKLEMPSVQSALNGAVIIAERAARLLGRLSTARGAVTLRTHFDVSNINVGDNVQIVHRYLPQQGGTLGFSDQLEVMSKSLTFSPKPQQTLKCEFTSYTGIRIPFIGPSPRITVVTDQKTIEVDDAACLTVGDPVKLFKDGALDIFGDPTIGAYLPDDINVIESIVGNIVTFTNNFVSILGTDITIKLPDYDSASSDQRAKYAFIGENSGFFSDGSKSYQIIF